MDLNYSYWADSILNYTKRSKLVETKKKDVAVIGAGFTGLSSALFLQKKGYKTSVIEQNTVGSGASGRNGSLMLVGYKHSLVNIAKRFGTDTAKEMLKISLDGIKLVKNLIDEYDIPCEFENKGSLNVAYKAKHFENLKKEQEFMYEKLQYENFIVEKSNLKEELGSPLYHGGMVDPNSCYFHPLKYALGLSYAVEKEGGEIFEDSQVISIKKKNKEYHIYTKEGKIVAKELITATNGYTTSLTKNLNKRMVPMNSNMLATEPLDESIVDTLIPNKRGVFDTKNLLYYFRISSDNRLLFGSRLPGKEDNKMYEQLRKKMIEVFPQLYNSQIDYKWGGKLSISRDMFPHIGVNKDGSHFSLGYSGHGVSLSTLMGKYIASNISGEEKEKNSLESLPFKKIPFYNQRELIVSTATRLFKLKDIVS